MYNNIIPQLNWSGVTVEIGRPYVHIEQAHHFDPVPIGAHAYPRQVCVYNKECYAMQQENLERN